MPQLVTEYPDLEIHGHALQPTRYTVDDGTIYGKRFKGHEVYVTLNTGARVTMILHEEWLEAYNEAMTQKTARFLALAAAEKRLAETSPSGVERELGSPPPQER
jgi:hypothetical protein